jgi:hypothetical protein
MVRLERLFARCIVLKPYYLKTLLPYYLITKQVEHLRNLFGYYCPEKFISLFF